jgi:hypothetical protein
MGRDADPLGRFDRLLAVAARVAIILVPLALVALYVHGHVRRPAANASEVEAQVKGSTLPTVPGVDFSASHRTLILALNVDCGFCKRSIPFYQRLLEAGARSGGTQIVAVFPNQEAEVSGYVRRNGLSCRSVHGFDVSTLGAYGTPTILLADEYGTVLDLWQGQLTQEKEAEVLRAL